MSLDVVVEGHVAVATLHRPAARNALDSRLRAELVEFWHRLREDRSIRAAVLTGSGDRAFCAGADLKDTTLDTSYLDETFGGRDAQHFMTHASFDTPLVCAVNGYALGGGLELALACDIRIASTTAAFGMPEVRVGSMPGAGGTQYLPRVMAMSDAMYLLLTGEVITAQRALEMRLISECLPPAELLPRAVAIAETIARNAPLSVRATKRMAAGALDVPLSVGLQRERAMWGLLKGSADRQEGRAAFRERRPPEYEGR